MAADFLGGGERVSCRRPSVGKRSFDFGAAFPKRFANFGNEGGPY